MASTQTDGATLGLLGLGAIALYILSKNATPAAQFATARGFSVDANDSSPGCTPCEAAKAAAFRIPT